MFVGIVNGGQYSQEFHLQHEQDINSKNNHKELINVLCYCRKPFPMFASYAEDGKILLWHSTDLHYLGSITHYDKSMVLNEELLRNLTVDQKTYVTKTSKAKINSSTKRVVCVISMVAMPLSGHLCVSSADSTIAMYDLASQELCGRITTIPDTPTCMTAFSIYEKAHDVKNQYLCIGDEVGYIYFVMFDAEFGMSSDAGAKKKNIQLFQNALTNMKRMRAQREGVTVLVYASELNQLIVAGVDGYIKFVNVSKKEINKSFHAHHSAIKCVAWSWAVKSMCTSALDRSVLVWDPYTFQISTKLEGFPSTIISVMVNERIQQLIVVFEDKTIRTWDSLTFEPLSTVIDPSVQSPSNCISASIWSQDLELLLTAGNRICSWHMEINPLEASVARDDDDLCTTLFNENFNTLLVVSKGGNVTVFSAEEGTILIKFSVAILSEEEVENSNNKYVKSSIRSGMLKPIVTTAMLDKAQRRLIIFNSNELQITLWNFNNGQCVSSFSPSLSIVSRIPLRERNNSNYIVPPTFQITCGTYEHVYSGPQRMLKRFCIFGTDEGIVAVNVETSEGFSDEPTFCLVRSDDNVRIVNQSNDTDNVQITYKRASVVWMKGCNENTILVSYSDGVILEWDLEKATPILEMKAMKKSLGLQFVPLRRKLITSRGGGGNRTENSDLKPASREGVSPTPNDATSDTTTNHFPQPFQSPVRRSMSISFERSTTGQFNVPLLITSQPSFSRADSSNPSSPSLAGSVTDVNEKITPMSSHKPRPPSAPRQLLTSYTAHTERLLAGDTSRTAGGNIVAPSAILGIARRTSNQVPSPRPEVKTGDGHAESKGLGEDIASSPRAKDVTSRLLPGRLILL
jgi:WD40 repeat protein